MDGKGEMNESKQFKLTCSSLGAEKIDSNNSVDSTIVSKDPLKLNDENEKESSLGTGKVVDSAKSSEITIQKQGERESSTSSYHGGDNTQHAGISYLNKANTSYLDRFINSAVVSSALIRMRVYVRSIFFTVAFRT